MTKVFVSLPMNGKTDEEIKERMSLIQDIAIREFGESTLILDSFIEEDCPGDANPGPWYLGRSLEILSKADVAIFDLGYQNAKGCVLEEKACESYEIDRYFLTGEDLTKRR